MKKYAVVLFVAVIVGFSILSCSDSESKISPLLKQTTVILNLGLPPENPGALNDSIWNRIRRFFAQDAVAQTAPANFSSILVRVIGADIGVIEKEFGPYGTVSLNVPSGSLRQFEVIASVAPGDPSAALSFRGTAVANLPAGETVSIPVLMGVYETKIVIPDPGPSSSPNNRIIQINDISGAGYTIKTGASIGFLGSFMPWDIDFDARGRIYIATNGFATGECRVIRLNNTNSTSYSLVADNNLSGIIALAVDRIRNYVYFSPSNPATATYGFRRCNLDGTGMTVVLTVTGVDTIQTVTGMDVDSSGMLYISGSNSLGQPRIFQYDPVAQTVTRVYTTNLNGPEDVRVISPYIYVANANGGANLKILQLDGNLQFVAGYGSQVAIPPDTNPGQFYGPRHFVAIRNDSLIIMDDYSAPTNADKLVSITNILGAGWTTLPTTGDGQSLFKFYYGC